MTYVCTNVTICEVDSFFTGPVMVLPDDLHSLRDIFLVFAVREKEGGRYLRPISARYMHAKEVMHYEKENPDV